MKTPEKMTRKQALKALEDWTMANCFAAKGRQFCKHCATEIKFKRANISIHLEEFAACVGRGQVSTLDIPFCPQCEPEPGDGCIHFPIDVEKAQRIDLVKLRGQKAPHPESVINCTDWPDGCSHSPKCVPVNEAARIVTELLRNAEVKSTQELEAEKELQIVCMRTTTPAYVRGAKVRIAGCGHEVWMAPSTQKIMEEGASYDRVICTDCMEERIKKMEEEECSH